MENFYKVPSALKILLIELVAVLFFPASIAGFITEIRPGLFLANSHLDGIEDWLMVCVGPLFFAWILYDIFRPRVKDQKWGIFFPVKFKFCSTHPSYVLIDVITIAFVTFFVWLGIMGGPMSALFWWYLATAFFFPIIRLIAWYPLGLKIVDLETLNAHVPAIWGFGIFAIIFGGSAIITALS